MKTLLFIAALAAALPLHAQSSHRPHRSKKSPFSTAAITFGPSFLYHQQVAGTLAVAFPYRVNNDAPVQFSGTRSGLFQSPFRIWNFNLRFGLKNHLITATVGTSQHDVGGGVGYGYRVTPRTFLGGRLVVYPVINFEAAAGGAILGTIDNYQRTITALGNTYAPTFQRYRRRYHKSYDADHIDVSYQHNFTSLAPGILLQLHPFRSILAVDILVTYNIVIRDRSKVNLEQHGANGATGPSDVTPFTNADITATFNGVKTTHVRYPFSGPCLTVRLGIAGPKP